MKTKPDHDLLLDDVLSEGAPVADDSLLSHTLLLARRRRLFRRTKGAVAATALLAVGVFLFRFTPERRAITQPAPLRAYSLVHTRPLPSGKIVVTVPLASNWLVATNEATRSIRSTPLHYGVLSDSELLTLIAPRAGAIVRSKTGFEHLVFVNPKDANGFPLN